MSIYILSGTLTNAPVEADPFLDVVAEDLEMNVVSRLNSGTSALAATAQYGDGVIFVNPEAGQAITEQAQMFLGQSEDVGAVVLPIALTDTSREPPETVSIAQSYDVVDALRRRDLGNDATVVIAHEYSRFALARVSPTLGIENLRLFICHRRADGEDLAASFDKALSVRHANFFRDLVSIQVGEPAQERIDEALETADVVVFFDSPASGESAWVAKELATALGRGIPILWIRVGTEGVERTPLPVRPSGAPHIGAESVPEDSASATAFGELADRVLEEAHELNLVSLRTARATFSRIHAQCVALNRNVEILDARLQIYAISEAADSTPYPRRQSVHIVQVFARRPTASDQDQLVSWLAEAEYGPHVADCRAFDAAVMLDPHPGESATFSEFGVSEPASVYLSRLSSEPPERDQHHDGTMVLLGAFPTPVATHQGVLEAVLSVSTTWLELGGRLVCGGHPTFVPLLTEALRSAGGDLDRLTVFWSRYFATDEAIEALSTQATVVAIDAVDDDRDDSLTSMRSAMIGHSSNAAVVGIGGRTSELGSHVPGLDEEVGMAREAHLPVYLLGVPGGQSGVLLDDAALQGWSALGNPLNVEDNELLRRSDRYEEIAKTIWSGHS